MLDFIAWAFVGWLVYRMIISWLELKRLQENVSYAVEIIQEQAKNIVVVFECVKYNDEEVILCYDTENNFIAQGPSQDEVVKIAQKRFPNRNIATFKNQDHQWINPESENNSQNG